VAGAHCHRAFLHHEILLPSGRAPRVVFWHRCLILLLQATSRRPSATLLSKPDASLDQIGQTGILHDLRDGSCSGLSR
jgi:hypothetical protein